MSIFLIDAITCNHTDLKITERGQQTKLRTFDEKNIYSYFSLIFICSTAQRWEHWEYALCSLRTTVTNMPPPLLEALRALRAEETETRHQTWLPPSCTGQCTLHCQPGLHLKCVALLTTKREQAATCRVLHHNKSNLMDPLHCKFTKSLPSMKYNKPLQYSIGPLQNECSINKSQLKPSEILQSLSEPWSIKILFSKRLCYHITAGGPCRAPQRVDT